MVVVDRWFILGVLGLIGMAVSAAGEFLHWWDQFGEWAFWFSMGITILGFLLNATRTQVGRVAAGVDRVDANTRRIEANTQRIEANTEAIPRIEANTQQTQANTAEAVALLREIRDRLPARGG